jgi:hypothetical protein
MKRLLLILCLALVPVACTPPTTIVTAPGKIAFSAEQVTIRVAELQNAATTANKAGGLDDAQTKILVTYTIEAARVLKATPTGWQATVVALWKEAAPKITTTNTAVQFAITALTGVLASL